MVRLIVILFFVCVGSLQADVLIIGDSVSLDWQPVAEDEFDANFIHAFNGTTSNNQGTRASLRMNPGDDQLRIENYIDQSDDWDAIIFNAGIHDMRSEEAFETTIQEYTDNLNTIYDVLDRTGAPIYWVTTTPIPELHPTLDFNDHALYRTAGLAVALNRADFVIDLYAAVVDDFPMFQRAPDNLHFNAAGNQVLGSAVANALSSTGAPFQIGDVSRDGAVNFQDISSFISLLSVGGFQNEADLDQSGAVNFLDIAPFIAILSGQ